MGFGIGFGGSCRGPDVTDDGRRAVTSVTSKAAVDGLISLTSSDVRSGLVVSDESSEFQITIAGSAVDFISDLGASADNIYKLWVINPNSGAMRIERSGVTGKWAFCGDSQTARAGVLELQFVVAASDTLVVACIAHNQIR